MLNLETRMEVLGVTVFQDANQPSRFYHLPLPPHITLERGQPLFDLFSYRKGGEAGHDVAGGFLNMVVDVGLGGLKPRLEGRLKEQYGDDVTLAPVPYTRGTARVIGLGEDSGAGATDGGTAPSAPAAPQGPRFVEHILGAGQPSLDGDNRAIFSFSLSEDGAAFMMGVLSGAVNARPVGVIYTLDYVGLLPAYDLEISIDFKSSYEYARSRFTLGTLLFRADIDNIVEHLKQEQHIRIRETARTLALSDPAAIRERQNRIDTLVKDLATGALFQPSLTPGEPKVRGETITAADPTVAVPATTGTVPGTVGAALQHGPSAAVAAGTGAMLAGREHTEPEVGATGPAGPGGTASTGTGATGGTGPAGTTGSAPESAGDVWNRLGRPQAAYVLKNIRQEEQRTVTYNLSQVSAQAQSIAPQNFIQFLSSEHDLRDHLHVVDLNHPFFARINLNVNAQGVDFAAEGVVQLTVQLRYGRRPDGSAPKDTAEVILRSSADSKEFTFFADSAQTQWYEYKLIADYRSSFGIGLKDARVESGWIRTEARSLAVHPGWLGRVLPVTLQLAPSLSADVAEVHAVVRYTNADRQIDDSAQITLSPQHRSELLHLRLAGADEQFQVTPTVFYTGGSSEALPTLHLPNPGAGEPGDVVVVDAPRGGQLNGDVIMLDPLGELQSVVVDTEVSQDGHVLDSRSLDLSTPGKRELFSVRLARHDQPAQMRYRERRVFKDGGLDTGDWQEPGTPNLVVGIPAQGVVTVAVRYLGPSPSQLGLSALLLDLAYRDPAGDPRFDQSDALLVTDDPQTFTQDWKVRLPSRQARTYTWKLTLLAQDGTETSTEVRTDTRDQLILRPPPR
ncbi:hypothetical protein K7W42_03385 [Deinococcus sp. HMF7604]|uniref:hypothetical protein n=1 Tax=Deinococcus betulae TaxID=2873312 RepID=UPI001CCB452D|nr:hypothetical protein [Deinococcus betulae]MBZ9749902.1 hypothetical protein [Deinococcus betulae]